MKFSCIDFYHLIFLSSQMEVSHLPIFISIIIFYEPVLILLQHYSIYNLWLIIINHQLSIPTIKNMFNKEKTLAKYIALSASLPSGLHNSFVFVSFLQWCWKNTFSYKWDRLSQNYSNQSSVFCVSPCVWTIIF